MKLLYYFKGYKGSSVKFVEDIANVKKVMIFPDFDQKSHTNDLAILKLDKKFGLTMALNSHFEQQLTFPWIDQRFKKPIYDLHFHFECFTIANEAKKLSWPGKPGIVNFVPVKTQLLDRRTCIKCIQKDDMKWLLDVHNKCATINKKDTLIKV